jgi:hypothetical protein
MKYPTQGTSLIRILSLLCLASGLGFAGTWSGNLVDAKCYQALASNHNVSDSPVLQDVTSEVRFCSPKASTHAFAVVRSDDVAVPLNSTGNAQAAQLVRKNPRRSPIYVLVSGEMRDHKIAVNSISPAQ